MSNLSIASTQWATRPDDQRFVSLTDLDSHFQALRRNSMQKDVANNLLTFRPADEIEDKGLYIIGPSGKDSVMSDASFAQLTEIVNAPKGFLSTLPAHIAADALNHKFKTIGGESKLLLTKDSKDVTTVRAATSKTYGRIWNADVTAALVSRFGDGTGNDGPFKVPGEFGVDVPITKANTTIYGSPRDMFVFLADEKHRIELPNRRDGKSGSLARGFYIQNSETGHEAFKGGFFLFDYACKNRTIWGANEFVEFSIKHTSQVHDRWLEDIAPRLNDYALSKASVTEKHLIAAQNTKAGDNSDEVLEFLAKHFGTSKIAKQINQAHIDDEQRPIESLWDVSVGATAFARGIPFQNERVMIERKAGKILDLVAA